MGSRAAVGKISDSGQDCYFAFVMELETVSLCMGKILPGQDPAHGSGDGLRCVTHWWEHCPHVVPCTSVSVCSSHDVPLVEIQ